MEQQLSYVFPGQGSQAAGMGKEMFDTSPAARLVFEESDRLLGFPLTELCFLGPAEKLNDTQYAQPALLVAGVAYLRALQERLDARGVELAPIFVAGHSLGEYTALVAAGSLTFEDGVRLVWERGRLMKEAGEKRPGGMAAVIGLAPEKLEQVVKDASDLGTIVIANQNSPTQTVISGEVAPLVKAMDLAKDAGARVTRLAVSIASHSPLMEEAATQLGSVIDTIDLKDPRVPLVGNAGGHVITTAAQIRTELADQLCQPVAWVASVETMVENGTEAFLEVGPGQVLTGLIKRINANVRLLKFEEVAGST